MSVLEVGFQIQHPAETLASPVNLSSGNRGLSEGACVPTGSESGRQCEVEPFCPRKNLAGIAVVW